MLSGAGIGGHKVRHTDQAMGQHSRAELFDSAWEMPQVRNEDFADVSRSRVSHGGAVFALLSSVRRLFDNAEVVAFLRAHRCAGIHGHPRTDTSRPCEFYGLGHWPVA